MGGVSDWFWPTHHTSHALRLPHLASCQLHSTFCQPHRALCLPQEKRKKHLVNIKFNFFLDFLGWKNFFSKKCIQILEKKFFHPQKLKNRKIHFQHFLAFCFPVILRLVWRQSGKKWSPEKFLKKKFSEKKFLNILGIPQKRQKLKKIFFHDFKENRYTIILRPKWGNLSVKWSRGEFYKLENAKRKFCLVPFPLKKWSTFSHRRLKIC